MVVFDFPVAHGHVVAGVPAAGDQSFSGHTALVMVATFVLTVPVAALSYSLVEEPARRRINAWWKQRTSAQSTATPKAAAVRG